HEGAEANEFGLRLDVHLGGDGRLLENGGEALFEPVLEGVAQGDELYVLVGGERVLGCAGAAAAAADQADPEPLAARRGYAGGGGQRRGGGGGGDQELAAGGVRGHGSSCFRRSGLQPDPALVRLQT